MRFEMCLSYSVLAALHQQCQVTCGIAGSGSGSGGGSGGGSGSGAASCDSATGPQAGMCPMASCRANFGPDCKFVNEFTLTNGNCCAKLCNFKDSSGNACKSRPLRRIAYIHGAQRDRPTKAEVATGRARCIKNCVASARALEKPHQCRTGRYFHACSCSEYCEPGYGGGYNPYHSMDIGVWEGCSGILGENDTAVQNALLRNLSFKPSQFEYRSEPTAKLLDEPACHALMKHADAQHSADEDQKIVITQASLDEMTGVQAMRRILALFNATRGTVSFKIRRVQASSSGNCINFHLDHSYRTMQIPLNSDFEGGRLVYLTPHGLVSPHRPAGSFTLHDNRILHGVTKLTRGVRHSLFLQEELRTALTA